jgi:hypothetical protein
MSTYTPTLDSMTAPVEPARHVAREPARHASAQRDAVRFVVAAACVSVACLIALNVLDMSNAPAPHGVTNPVSQAPRIADVRHEHGVDHGVTAADAPSMGDAETVEASIGAYDR